MLSPNFLCSCTCSGCLRLLVAAPSEAPERCLGSSAAVVKVAVFLRFRGPLGSITAPPSSQHCQQRTRCAPQRADFSLAVSNGSSVAWVRDGTIRIVGHQPCGSILPCTGSEDGLSTKHAQQAMHACTRRGKHEATPVMFGSNDCPCHMIRTRAEQDFRT